MKAVLDLADLAHPNPEKRIQAIQTLGLRAGRRQTPALQARLKIETDRKRVLALREAIALIRLKDANDSVKARRARRSSRNSTRSRSADALKAVAQRRPRPPRKTELVAAASRRAGGDRQSSLDGEFLRHAFPRSESRQHPARRRARPRNHVRADGRDQHGARRDDRRWRLHDLSSCRTSSAPASRSRPLAFRVNHSRHRSSPGRSTRATFIAALPLSFLAAAVVGIGLERGIIRFLYRRPLESLLATWGVSLVLQQLLRR